MAARISRRGILAGTLAAPLAALPAAAAPRGGGTFHTTLFAIPEGGHAMIGLLVPAVQKVREAARLLLVGAAGDIVLSAPVPGGRPGLFRLEVIYNASRDPVLVLTHLGSSAVWTAPFREGPLHGLLLPAVRPDGRPGGLLGGSIEILSDGELAEVLPFSPLGLPGPEDAGAAFAGPVILAAGNSAGIGLLVPAVQKVREFSRVLLLNSAGDPFVDEPLPSQGRAPVRYRLEIIYSFGVFQVSMLFQDGSVRPVGRGASPDGMFLGVALPAVQIDGSPAGLMAGTLQVPATRHQFGNHVIFCDGHVKWAT